MVCPYCSTDMEPIELSGKVFCSNCGLTIKNNGAAQQVNTVSQQFNQVESVATDVPDEIQFPVVPEIAEALEQRAENSPETLIPSTDENLVADIAPPSLPTEVFNPITQSVAEELGVEPVMATETAIEPITPDVETESRIPDLAIPTESDFETPEVRGEATPQSFIELADPGSETAALEASSILLDILGEEPRKLRVDKTDVLKDQPQNPIEHPELEPGEPVDPKTEKKIEKLEEKIESIPEPVIAIPAGEISNYDPDTIKSKAIKEYFNSALNESRNKPTAKPKNSAKKAKNKKPFNKKMIIIILTVCSLALLVVVYFVYTSLKPSPSNQTLTEATAFAALIPGYVPEGYEIDSSEYSADGKTFDVLYTFASDSTKTILLKQTQTDNAAVYIADYLSKDEYTFIEKEVSGITFTEVDGYSLLWAKNGFVFTIEPTNFTFSNELLYQMAESI